MIGRAAVMAMLLVAIEGCSATKMIEMPYGPLPASEAGSGPVDVISYLEAPGQLPPLHTVALAPGDVEYRFGVVGHMALGATQTIVRVVRAGGKAQGEVWCQRLAWELADSTHGMPSQVARTHLEHAPNWSQIIDSLQAIDLMTYRPGERPAGPGIVPRDQTDQPSLLFEGREGVRYRSFGMVSRSPTDAEVWARLTRVIRMVWGEQHYGCHELVGPEEPWDPHSMTQWHIRPDSLGVH